LHGEKLGCSHPDVVAERPVAVLFDEGTDLIGYLLKSKIALKGAYSGERCLRVDADDLVSCAPWYEGSNVFGETLPNWDFEIAEDPKPGQYRYLQFAWKALTPETKSAYLQLVGDGDAHTHALTVYAGPSAPADAPNPYKAADALPGDWQVVRVDLWDVFKKPVRIRAMRLSSHGGSAAFDQVLLGRAEKDLPPVKK